MQRELNEPTTQQRGGRGGRGTSRTPGRGGKGKGKANQPPKSVSLSDFKNLRLNIDSRIFDKFNLVSISTGPASRSAEFVVNEHYVGDPSVPRTISVDQANLFGRARGFIKAHEGDKKHTEDARAFNLALFTVDQQAPPLAVSTTASTVIVDALKSITTIVANGVKFSEHPEVSENKKFLLELCARTIELYKVLIEEHATKGIHAKTLREVSEIWEVPHQVRIKLTKDYVLAPSVPLWKFLWSAEPIKSLHFSVRELREMSTAELVKYSPSAVSLQRMFRSNAILTRMTGISEEVMADSTNERTKKTMGMNMLIGLPKGVTVAETLRAQAGGKLAQLVATDETIVFARVNNIMYRASYLVPTPDHGDPIAMFNTLCGTVFTAPNESTPSLVAQVQTFIGTEPLAWDPNAYLVSLGTYFVGMRFENEPRVMDAARAPSRLSTPGLFEYPAKREGVVNPVYLAYKAFLKKNVFVKEEDPTKKKQKFEPPKQSTLTKETMKIIKQLVKDGTPSQTINELKTLLWSFSSEFMQLEAAKIVQITAGDNPVAVKNRLKIDEDGMYLSSDDESDEEGSVSSLSE